MGLAVLAEMVAACETLGTNLARELFVACVCFQVSVKFV